MWISHFDSSRIICCFNAVIKWVFHLLFSSACFALRRFNWNFNSCKLAQVSFLLLAVLAPVSLRSSSCFDFCFLKRWNKATYHSAKCILLKCFRVLSTFIKLLSGCKAGRDDIWAKQVCKCTVNSLLHYIYNCSTFEHRISLQNLHPSIQMLNALKQCCTIFKLKRQTHLLHM